MADNVANIAREKERRQMQRFVEHQHRKDGQGNSPLPQRTHLGMKIHENRFLEKKRSIAPPSRCGVRATSLRVMRGGRVCWINQLSERGLAMVQGIRVIRLLTQAWA